MLTHSQIQELLTRYQQGEPTKVLANHYGVTPQTIAYHLKKSGIQVRHSKNTKNLNIHELTAQYMEGKSVLALATSFGVGQPAIKARLERAGVSLRSISEQAKLVTPVNTSWLDSIDSPEKAWVLGWMATDGCVHDQGKRRGQRAQTLILDSKDADVLGRFHQLLGGSLRSYKHLHRTEWCAYSDALNERLRALGVHPRKSLSVNVDLEQIPLQFHRDFARGCFEGDGSVFQNSRGQWGIHFGAGSEALVLQFRNLLPIALNICRRKNQEFYSISTLSKKKVLTLLCWLYGAGDYPCMQRKQTLAVRAITELREVCDK